MLQNTTTAIDQTDEEDPRIAGMVEEYGEDILTEEEAEQYYSSQPELSDPDDHYANLAEHIDDSTLAQISTKIQEWVDADEQGRTEWQERERKGILLLGVSENTEGGANFTGAAKVVHPLLVEACVQFQARAMDAMWPSSGPVDTIILGDKTEELVEQSHRVREYMNYQYTQQMPGAYEQHDKMLFRLPISGSTFKKVYYDPLDRVVVSRFVNSEDFLVPYTATTLRDTPRYTHIERVAQNDLRKLQLNGFYRDVRVGIPSISGDDVNQEVKDEIDAVDGRADASLEDDSQHTIYETNCYYDIPGFEDVGKDGEPTGIALPYIITVEKDSGEVLSIRRNWREADVFKAKRVHFTHYRFLPGLGFYGYGFLHILGGLSRAATGALRALLDAAHFNNLPGGFKDKDAKIPNGDTAVGPGEWRDVDSSGEELSKSFFKLPYSEPSQALFRLLGYLDDIGRRFAGTTEAVVGDASNNGPVGTTLALIEQGLKVFSGIHRRLHMAAAEEFKIVSELNFEFIPDEGYPYNIKEGSADVFYQDFDGRIDVIPVNDPNIVTNTQRIVQAQTALQLAEKAPHLYDLREANRRILEALRIPDIDTLLPGKQEAQRLGPVEEMQMFMVGRPVKSFIDQHHEAHIAVHRASLMSIPDDIRKAVEPAVMAHIQEHLAMAFTLQIQQATGVQIPIVMDGEMAELPPEIEYKVAAMAGQAVASMTPQLPPPEALEAQRKEQEAAADIARRDAIAEADIRRDDAEFIADEQRKIAEQEIQLLEKYGVA